MAGFLTCYCSWEKWWECLVVKMGCVTHSLLAMEWDVIWLERESLTSWLLWMGCNETTCWQKKGYITHSLVVGGDVMRLPGRKGIVSLTCCWSCDRLLGTMKGGSATHTLSVIGWDVMRLLGKKKQHTHFLLDMNGMWWDCAEVKRAVSFTCFSSCNEVWWDFLTEKRVESLTFCLS